MQEKANMKAFVKERKRKEKERIRNKEKLSKRNKE